MATSRRAIESIAFCLSFFLSGWAVAQGPIVVREYQFLPQLSSLHLEGGFAYVNVDLGVSGNFELATGLESHSTQLEPYAQFVVVDAVASDGLWNLDLDWALNLTGLEGTFDPARQRELFFSGFEGQGQPMFVEARVRGRQLHLRGFNRPGCCDMFSYTLDAVARQLQHPGLFDEKEGGSTVVAHAVPEPFASWIILPALVTWIVAARSGEFASAHPRRLN